MYCSAQRLEVSDVRRVKGDSAAQKKTNQYIGLQANQLISQLLNFSGSTPSISNPYLLVYSVNSTRTGSGFSAGLGYNVQTTETNSNPTQTNKTSINSFSLRLGYDKKSYLGRKWLINWGLDFIIHNEDNTTKNESSFQGSSNSTETRSNLNYWGFGPRAGLSFFISDRILLGTEATYYFKTINNTSHITNTSTFLTIDPNTGQQIKQTTTSSQDSSGDNTEFSLTLPVAIFLIVKF